MSSTFMNMLADVEYTVKHSADYLGIKKATMEVATFFVSCPHCGESHSIDDDGAPFMADDIDGMVQVVACIHCSDEFVIDVTDMGNLRGFA